MGCLKSIIKKILIILALIAFFALGGYSFCKKKFICLTLGKYYLPKADFCTT